MACDRFSSALRDHALGTPLEPPVAAHLAVCGACQERLANERELAQIIDGAVASVGAIQSPPDFRVRVAERIGDRSALSYRGLRVPRFAAAAAAMAAVVVVSGLGVWWWRDRITPTTAVAGAVSTAPITAKRSVTVPSPPTQAASVDSAPSTRAEHHRAAPVARRSSAPPFDVLVPPGQHASLARFVAGLNSQDPDIASRLMGRSASARPTMTTELSVAAIVIEPVVVPDLPTTPALLTN
jgi:hypothetical protein